MKRLNPSMQLDELLEMLAEYLDLDDLDCLSLPPAAYLSPALNALEVEEIFHHEWLCVGREEYIPNPGDYYSFDLLGEALLIVRGEDGELRADGS